MGIAVVASRSGITQMGLAVAERVGICAIGRATHKRFLCFSAAHRLVWQPELAPAALTA
jgi:FdhD protein